jgi:hypothetical protein
VYLCVLTICYCLLSLLLRPSSWPSIPLSDPNQISLVFFVFFLKIISKLVTKKTACPFLNKPLTHKGAVIITKIIQHLYFTLKPTQLLIPLRSNRITLTNHKDCPSNIFSLPTEPVLIPFNKKQLKKTACHYWSRR